MILGIDYGRKKIGLALAESKLAYPFKVLRVEDFDEALFQVKKIIDLEKVNEVVVGVSENEMGEESKRFAQALGAKTFDETLSTYKAQQLSQEANVRRKKRKEMEDAYAATVMLQDYIDSKL